MTEEHVVFDAESPQGCATPRLVTDGVMGGVSRGRLKADVVAGRRCLRLQGEVSLANNGGFLQAAFDLRADGGVLDASRLAGVLVTVLGNGEVYNLHLRSADLDRPWQSYRCEFHAAPGWHQHWRPFDRFSPHRTDRPLDPRRLRRVGVVAIGREFETDVCIARIALVAAESGFATAPRNG